MKMNALARADQSKLADSLCVNYPVLVTTHRSGMTVAVAIKKREVSIEYRR